MRVKRAPQPLERLEVGLAEHRRHVRLLVDADAVLAGDRAAGVDARLDDQARQLLGALRLALARGVVADERVEVPVAGVEHVRDPQLVLGGERVDLAQHLGQPRARDHAVLDVVGGGDPAHRRERRLAGAPDQVALLRALGDPHVERAGAAHSSISRSSPARHCSRGPSSSTSSAAPASSR